ncbi:SCO-spondin-like [Nematolebias whitei]|uniref:SCO-spondin-like n=1 Tax=Nematolebias whitei TaxID=451745 RepID=UPI0018991EA4|nr:SCO-spondin-like [Nematolebias whitei]
MPICPPETNGSLILLGSRTTRMLARTRPRVMVTPLGSLLSSSSLQTVGCCHWCEHMVEEKMQQVLSPRLQLEVSCSAVYQYNTHGWRLDVDRMRKKLGGDDGIASYYKQQGQNASCFLYNVCEQGLFNCTQESCEKVQQCPHSLVYSPRSCLLTCSSLDLPGQQLSQSSCRKPLSGCVCPSGTVLHGDLCVLPDECPCHHNGQIYYSNDTITKDCNTCVCRKRRWHCTQSICAGVCVATGDPHYVTYDGRIYSFLGDCQYVLTRETSGLFSVTAENVPCGSTGVTCTKSVTLSLGKTVIHLLRGKAVTVNGMPITLPKSYSGSGLSVERVGLFVVLSSRLGITVLWDGGMRVYLRLEVHLRGRVGGLCGNFDGDTENDFTTRQGIVESTPELFGNSWKISPSCPDVENQDLRDPCVLNSHRVTWARKKCAVLTQELFSLCHTEVPFQQYYDWCIFDACGCDSGGDCECLCTAIASYAEECNRRGVYIHWRSQELCPLQCEKGLVYNPCGPACTLSCPSVHQSSYSQCAVLSCVEGCFCPAGTVRHGDSCIMPTQCPCEWDGSMYPAGTSITKHCQNCSCNEGIWQCEGVACPPPPSPCLESEVACTSGRCIPSQWVCDNEDDCGDGSDEICPSTCSPEQFRCSSRPSGPCLNLALRCDGHPDCADQSDEEFCGPATTVPSCSPGEFQCANGKCLPVTRVCDGRLDCGFADGSDEQDCGVVCDEGEFLCPGGRCILYIHRCDGHDDCGNLSDERGCVCEPGYFQCPGDQCIPVDRLCDGHKDCPSGTDEAICASKVTCAPNQFACADGTCVAKSKLCDGTADCPNSEDEHKTNCYTEIITPPVTPTSVCRSYEFICANGGQCVPRAWQCDGETDCQDGSDEQQCAAPCSPGQVPCLSGDQCVYYQQLCDGTPHCRDASDESVNNCGSAKIPSCPGSFPCDNHTCVNMLKVCNGIPDCPRGDDELVCDKTISPVHPGSRNVTTTCSEFTCLDGTCVPFNLVCNGVADCPDSSRTAFGRSTDEQGCRTWSSWGPWSSCSTSCGTGSMSRYRTCPPGNSLHRCWGQDNQRQQCFNTTCPVDSQWLPWGRWSNCSRSCGGVQVRHRECIPPQYGGRHCSQFEGPTNLSLEFKPCSNDGCTNTSCPPGLVRHTCTPCPVSCAHISSGITCDPTTPCFSGCWCPEGQVMSYTQQCVLPEECACEVAGVRYWPGQQIKLDCEICVCERGKPQRCQPNLDCSVHCGWSSWSEWGECLGPCGVQSVQWSFRSPNNPTNHGDGRACRGIYRKARRCQTAPCDECEYQGRFHAVGERWRAEPCLLCHCSLNLSVQCDMYCPYTITGCPQDQSLVQGDTCCYCKVKNDTAPVTVSPDNVTVKMTISATPLVPTYPLAPGAECWAPLGVQTLPASSFKASSHQNAHPPEAARLHWWDPHSDLQGWSPEPEEYKDLPQQRPEGHSGNMQSPYIQIDLLKAYNITGVLTQGGGVFRTFVTSFYLQFSQDGSHWYTYKELVSSAQPRVKLFLGNYDDQGVTESRLDRIVLAQFVRLLPHDFQNGIYLRLEIMGCVDGYHWLSSPTPPSPVSPVWECKEKEFQCENGHCVPAGPLGVVCDGKNDCGDGSDETSCGTQAYVTSSSLRSCPTGQFSCLPPGGCIEIRKRCDGIRNCPRGEDENGCHLHDVTTHSDRAYTHTPSPLKTPSMAAVTHAAVTPTHGGPGYYGICSSPLGLEDGRIHYSQLSSSSHRENNPADAGRLNIIPNIKVMEPGWSPLPADPQPYLQVDFREPKWISGVVTQGNEHMWGYLTKYHVAFSLQSDIFTDFTENGKPEGPAKVFEVQMVGSIPVTRWLGWLIRARYVRIIPVEFKHTFYLRVEILGCRGDELVTPGSVTSPSGFGTVSEQRCNAGQFLCEHTKECIPMSVLCDGRPNCKDHSDELNCGTSPTRSFPGLHNQTIYTGKTVFHVDNVTTGGPGIHTMSMQSGFPGVATAGTITRPTVTPLPPPTPGPCSSKQFHCDSGECIHKDRKCDLGWDCLDGSDEKDCVDCILSPWTAWSACSMTCGLGSMFRQRDILRHALPGGFCNGAQFDSQACFPRACPVHGYWSKWTEWSECDTLCGGGVRQRNRTCSAPPPKNGGRDCEGMSQQRQSCNSQPCTTDTGTQTGCVGGMVLVTKEDCQAGRVDPCSSTCSELSMTNNCTSTCIEGCRCPYGLYLQEGQCVNSSQCVCDWFGEILHPGQVINRDQCITWGSLNKLSVCPVGMVYMTAAECVAQGGACPRVCLDMTFTEVQCVTACYDGCYCSPDLYLFNGSCVPLAQCPCYHYGKMQPAGTALPFDTCNNCTCTNGKMKCGTVPCPVDCGWSSWTQWSACSQTCDVGVRRRYRSGTNPPLAFGGRPCKGERVGIDTCSIEPCLGIKEPWSMWSECSVTCGGGYRTRTRGPIRIHGTAQQFSACSLQPCGEGRMCPPGQQWKQCLKGAVFCTDFTSDISRNCTPGCQCLHGTVLQDGGCVLESDCRCDVDGQQFKPGDIVLRSCNNCTCDGGRLVNCSQVICNVDGQWSTWTPWSQCSVSCGTGLRSRYHFCSSPQRSGSGLPCLGPHRDDQVCITTPCDRHGAWSLWNKWTECTKSCGVGVQSRRRHCDNPTPEGEGNYCEGLGTEVIACNTDHCPVLPCSQVPGTVFSSCGPSCPRSCDDLSHCEWHCEPGCYCTDGKVLSANGTVCVAREDCPCLDLNSGHRLEPGEISETPDGCNNCTCDGGRLNCTRKLCPVSGGWCEWSEWTPCTRACGAESVSRYRSCSCPEPKAGGEPCSEEHEVHSGIGVQLQRHPCPVISFCPIHGSWSSWSAWSECDGCAGSSTRFRECNSPPARFGGLPCLGESQQSRGCHDNITVCSNCGGGQEKWTCGKPCARSCSDLSEDMECLESPECSWTCGCPGDMVLQDGVCVAMEECRCKYHNNSITGNNNMSWVWPGGYEWQFANPGEIILSACKNCCYDLVGPWLPWSQWSSCSVSCGGGQQARSRVCSSLPCHGLSRQSKTCNTQVCLDVGCPPGRLYRECEHGEGCPFSCAQVSGKEGCYSDGCEEGCHCPPQTYQHHGLCIMECPCLLDKEFLASLQSVSVTPVSSLLSSNVFENAELQSGETFVHDCSTCGCEHGRWNCSLEHCPLDGGLTPWGLWSSCSLSCGGLGVKTRTRGCVQPAPAFGGKDCQGPRQETTYCQAPDCPGTAVIPTEEPTIPEEDSGFLSWSLWSPCTKTCTDVQSPAVKFRHRQCAKAVCFGISHQEKACNLPQCPGEVCAAVDCAQRNCSWLAWGEWSSCSRSCGVGQQQRIRTFLRPGANGSWCEDIVAGNLEQRFCNIMPCRVDGGWSRWSPWSLCDKRCGGGRSIRTRSCSSPPPKNGGKKCDGEKNQVKPCNTKPCDGKGCPPGQEFVSCAKQCPQHCSDLQQGIECQGNAECQPGCRCPKGQLKQDGVCVDLWQCDCLDSLGKMWAAGSWHQVSCNNCSCSEGQLLCTNHSCQTSCVWSSWSSWATCSVSCGQGQRTRYRSLIPDGERTDCHFEEVQHKSCNPGSCPPLCLLDRRELSVGDTWLPGECKQCTCTPEGVYCQDIDCRVDGDWTPWSVWSDCSVTCGQGTHVRTRACINPPPRNNGSHCTGPERETQYCQTPPCLDDLCPWSPWSPCSQSCGAGSMLRHRVCVCEDRGETSCSPEAERVSEETQLCYKQPCPGCPMSTWSVWSQCSCESQRQQRYRVALTSATRGQQCTPVETHSRACSLRQCEACESPFAYVACGAPCEKHCALTGSGDLCLGARECTPGCYCPEGLLQQNGSCVPLHECGCVYLQHQASGEPPTPVILPQGTTVTVDCSTCLCHDGTLHCDTRECQDLCQWSAWSVWTVCAEPCSGGVRQRYRWPLASPLGPRCRSQETQSQSCNTGLCPGERCEDRERTYQERCANQCPRSCADLWDHVQCLQGTCHSGCRCPEGQLLQDSHCVPVQECRCGIPSGNGTLEFKPREEVVIECNTCLCENGTLVCTKLPCPVYEPWSPWSMCTVSCGHGQRTRTRRCQDTDGGPSCSDTEQIESCDLPSCPVGCFLSGWSAWSECSTTCGGGVSVRNKTIIQEPEPDGAACVGPLEQHTVCNTNSCLPECPHQQMYSNCASSCPFTCEDLWPHTQCLPGPCTAGCICPPGQVLYAGSCMHQADCPCSTLSLPSGYHSWNISTEGFYEALLQPGTSIQHICNTCVCQGGMFNCTSEACDVDCQWSSWSAWSPCSASCGTGQQTSTRSVLQPSQYGGAPCEGFNLRTTTCIALDCVCPDGEHWRRSVSEDVPLCERSCQDIYSPSPVNCSHSAEGCVCQEGLYRNQEGVCVIPALCPCHEQEIVWEAASEWEDGCLSCSCVNGKKLCHMRCPPLYCDEGEVKVEEPGSCCPVCRKQFPEEPVPECQRYVQVRNITKGGCWLDNVEVSFCRGRCLSRTDVILEEPYLRSECECCSYRLDPDNPVRFLSLQCESGENEPVVLPVIYSCECTSCQGEE